MGYYEQRTPRFAGSTPYVPVTAVTLLAVTGQLVPSQNAETGDTIKVTVRPGDEHAFHPETGERLG